MNRDNLRLEFSASTLLMVNVMTLTVIVMLGVLKFSYFLEALIPLALVATAVNYLFFRKCKDLSDRNALQISTLQDFNRKEIERLSKNLNLMANGDFNIDANVTQADEYTQKEFDNYKTVYSSLGATICSIKSMIEDSNVLSDSVKKGDLTKRTKLELHKGGYRKVLEGFNQTLDLVVSPLNITTNYLERLSQGHIPPIIEGNYEGRFRELIQSLNSFIYTNKEIVEKAKQISEGLLYVELHKRSESDELMSALGNMVDTFTGVIQKLNLASSNVAAAGKEINGAAIQISRGTNEQAASSEEVSTSMDQMTATIRRNTDNSKMAEVRALTIDGHIESVQRSFDETKMAMWEIAEKIKVINDIAKKTDILAINASIEASRAGDAGKGFSVVAAEIRKLAEHSFMAATQIEGITENSVNAAQQSYTLIEELIPELKETSVLMQAISSSSAEQLEGAEQVGAAMQELAQVIQQNTTSSEELTSISEEFVAIAGSIEDEIKFFKLEKEEGQTMSELTDLLDKYNQEIAMIKQKMHAEIKSQPEKIKVVSNGHSSNGVNLNLAVDEDKFEAI